jgi:site-specific recombinase XerD
VYQLVKHYGKKVGIGMDRFGPHAARATAATNALDAGTDIAKVQEWLGHANISTTRVYDHRKTRAEDSPVFKIKY